MTSLIGAVSLAACGGGDLDRPAGASAAAPADARAKALADAPAQSSFFPPGATIPTDANVRGMWSPVYSWPLISVHAVLLPDGRILTYGTKETGQQTAISIYDVWDGAGAPDQGHLVLSNGTGTDIFCSSQLVLPTGPAGVAISGGDNWTGTATTNTGNNNSNVFGASNNSLTRGPNMNRARWYSSMTTLINGELYVQGGSGGTDRPEVRDAAGNYRLLSGADTSAFDFQYPRNFVAPDGRVFGFDSAGRMYYVSAAGNGSVTTAGQLASANSGSDASAAMFRPGRILQFGGNSNGAVVIDITGGSPVVTATQSMGAQRRLGTATVLANGSVLATGGSQVWNQLTGVVYSADIWNPQNGQWTQGASGALARLYHSNAVLLPDASVMVMGGGAPGPLNNTNVEIYYPPYLFTAGGQRAVRPVLSSAPDFVDIGKTFSIQASSGSGVSRVAMVKTGSTTHGFNMDQRFVELTFKANGSTVNVQAPTKATDATPGYYHLFVFDAAGVPSVSRIVRMGVASNPSPAITPTVGAIGTQTTVVNTAASLAVSATDPNGDVLSYAAAGLPPGLSIDTATGVISGTPTTAGSYSVVVTVTDGVNVASTGFTWSVVNSVVLTLGTITTPGAVLANGSGSFSVSATGQGLQYRWNFGDGTGDTAWSTSPTATHTYAAPGTYTVTVTVQDAFGAVQSRSFLQSVVLPATAGKPSVSGNLIVTQPTSGNARLWVVNPDNDSVSVFDTVTRAKLAEIAVGAGPRALVQARNGVVVVSSKTAATLTRIDANSLGVLGTLALPRGSAPYGVAASPSSDHVYVALEASGEVRKIDTAANTVVATLAVGANVRHVSVSADGSRIYVSRFITPPLPGEGTASVVTTGNVGGEVLRLASSGNTLSLAATIRLSHSDKPDAENQGRGIPNYLGAVAISPDGTQAFVPSKQDNVKRGALRDGTGLNFQSTVRAISSRLNLAGDAEDLARRIDHDNASLASAAVFDARGSLLFVALETSREVAVVDAWSGAQLMRVDTGRAPQGLALSPDGKTLYVQNFMDRSVGVYDLRPLLDQGLLSMPMLATLNTVASERLSGTVLTGKQLFYDARDARLARDRYMSCASCHNDGGHDGRVWDLTGQGEGLRNTISLRGRAANHGFSHWSANFDEIQDFEGQIRSLAGGTGLMDDNLYFAGTRAQPLGDRKTGYSGSLDALAAYVASLSSFEPSPSRPSATTLSSAASAGKTLFQSLNCASCHGGTAFTGSGNGIFVDIGTVKPSSGSRLYGALTGIDVPTLRDAWATGPWLHDGSAPSLQAAIQAHGNVSTTAANRDSLAAYLREIGSDEAAAPQGAGSGTGLVGRYYRGTTPSGTVRLTQTAAVNFNWGSGSPSTWSVGSDNFSARYTGTVEAPVTGNYQFQTVSDDGVRLTVNGQQLINNWTAHSATTDTSGVVTLVAGQRYSVVLDYYEAGGNALIQLRWKPAGDSAFSVIPVGRLYPN